MMLKKTTILFSLLLGVVFLSDTVVAVEASQVKPYMKSFSTSNNAYVPFGSVEKKTIHKPVIILECEKSYKVHTGEVNILGGDNSYIMYIYRHAILNGKLTCEYEGYPPGNDQSELATKHLLTPDGTTCKTIPDFKFSCENQQANTCASTCRRKD